MSFHLEGPWLTTTGRRKGARKFRTAAAAQNSRILKTEWQELLDRHGVEQQERRQKRAMTAPAYVPPARNYRTTNLSQAPSLTDNVSGVCARPETKVYTGTECLGIAVLHKSCLQPVFNQQAAIDIAKMRRS